MEAAAGGLPLGSYAYGKDRNNITTTDKTAHRRSLCECQKD